MGKIFDMVLAVQVKRDDSIIKNITANIFYKIINLIFETPIYNNVGDFRLLVKKMADVVKTKPMYLLFVCNFYFF
jgi:polyisoprenyl-phosphate glycosyltransferase